MAAYAQKMISEEIHQKKLMKKAAVVKKATLCSKLDGRGKRFLIMFLDTSSIHGLNHFTKKGRHAVEIILWIVIVALALWGAIYLSMSTWERYQDSPTVVSMDRDMFAWNTTFPCVTVCPHNKLDAKKINTYMMRMRIKDPAEQEQFISFVKSLAIANYSNFENVTSYSGVEAKNYMQLLVNLSTSFNPGLTIGTSGVNLFLEPTITELGLCYAVNSKIAVYSSLGYREQNRRDIVEGNSTFFVHPLDGEIFAQVINLSTGYDVFLHGPLETPDIASQRHSSDDGFYMKLYVTALTIYTSPEAAKLSVLQRKCRFLKESNLPHSPVYSYNLCRIDCRISLCIKLCGCVPHFYRPTAKDKVCNVEGLHCLAKHTDFVLSLFDKTANKKLCECLPNCDDVNYVVQSMSLQHWFLGTNLQWGMVSYPKLRFRRDIIFGFTDVLVSVGGMAGLFLGCSVLSFMEIVYFFTLRLFWYLVNYKTENKVKHNDLAIGKQ